MFLNRPATLDFCRAGACVAKRGVSWYSEFMKPTPFELTPKQQGILAALSRATGKPIPALLDEALAALQEHERLAHEMPNGHDAMTPAAAETTKPFWQKALEASERVPEEDLARLPADLAAHVDHYIYGTPKR